MAFSTIQRKKCKCGCHRFPSIGYAGYSGVCAPDEVKEKVGNKRKVAQRNKNARLAAACKIRNEVNKESGETELVLWFKLKMNTSKKVCENCGADLSHYNEKDWHGSQHHIVDKALCPSVKSNPFNHLVLGMWCCHSQWHTSFLNASKMPVFSKAQEKFLLFEKDIDPSELKKVNPYLFQT